MEMIGVEISSFLRPANIEQGQGCKPAPGKGRTLSYVYRI